MIRDFEALKKQLSELSDAINRFKSEQVQLKVVELVLKNVWLSGGDDEQRSCKASRVLKSRVGRSLTGGKAPVKTERRPRDEPPQAPVQCRRFNS